MAVDDSIPKGFRDSKQMKEEGGFALLLLRFDSIRFDSVFLALVSFRFLLRGLFARAFGSACCPICCSLFHIIADHILNRREEHPFPTVDRSVNSLSCFVALHFFVGAYEGSWSFFVRFND